MESIITIVGFLGAGKTTLLKHLVTKSIEQGWNPFIILNDYENANLDVQQFLEQIDANSLRALSGSCICCSGIGELRNFVNDIPERENGITFIEANGTSDACSLMGFLGVGLNDRYEPPIQISVVDAKNWQNRGEFNELELNQIQVSSLVILTHLEGISEERKSFVIRDIKRVNSSAEVTSMEAFNLTILPKLTPSTNKPQQLDHLKAHWSSCSVDLPYLPNSSCINELCKRLPDNILRVKGCTKVGDDDSYTYFQRTPSGEVTMKAFYGEPTTGPKLLCVGPGSDPSVLEQAITESINIANDKTV